MVDNASTDGSADGLEALSLPLTVIRNDENLGFGAACNQGARGSAADYLLFLNPDTRLMRNSISVPVRFMERSENQAIGVCSIPLIGEDGQVSRTCTRLPAPRHFFAKILGLDRLSPGRFPSHFMTEWDHAESRDVDHVIGAFYLIRRSLFERLSGFDARFFVYLEDLDLSYRVHAAGARVFFLTDASAYHKGGGTSERVKATRLFYALRSRIQYGYKHFGWWGATSVMLATLLLEPFTRICLALTQRSFAPVKETLVGYAALWRTLPQWIGNRTSDT